jgi:hypothetical protein
VSASARSVRQPAGAAEGGVSFSRVAVNGGKPTVIEVKEEVDVPAVFRMTTRLRHDPRPTVFPYRGKPDTGDTLHSAIGANGPGPSAGTKPGA